MPTDMQAAAAPGAEPLMTEPNRSAPPLTRRMSGSGRPGLTPLNVGLVPGLGAGISLDSPHLTGLSNVMAQSGLASPLGRGPLRFLNSEASCAR